MTCFNSVVAVLPVVLYFWRLRLEHTVWLFPICYSVRYRGNGWMDGLIDSPMTIRLAVGQSDRMGWEEKRVVDEESGSECTASVTREEDLHCKLPRPPLQNVFGSVYLQSSEQEGANEDDAGKVVDIFIEFPPPPHLRPLILRKRHRSLCRQIAYSLNLSHHLYSGMTDKLSAPWVPACCSATHAHTIIDYHL